MIRESLVFCSVVVVGFAVSACGSTSAGGSDDLFTGGTSAGGTSGAGASGGMATGGGTSSGGGGGLVIDSGPGTGGGGTNCTSGPTEDKDQDGFSVQDGDCNDCDANANPGAYDVAGNNVDEDCNGTADDSAIDCDGALTDLADNDPMNGARSMGLCQQATAGDKKWGVLEAKYVMADGTAGMNDLSHGLLTAFGPNVNVQEGKRMLVLSSGTARQPTDPGYQSVGGANMNTTSPPPSPQFPIDTPTCPGVTTTGKPANDPAALELKIRVPTNAKSFSFNFNFYTYEWPGFVCSSYNDFFAALQTPAPPNAALGNISFDAQGNPVSVNNAFLEACGCSSGPPCTAKSKVFACSLGTTLLDGTGFGDPTYPHAATGWLETKSPVTPGSEVTLRFAIWDAGDHVLDSTVLLDNFVFSADEASGGSITKPVPTPK
jgi:hypothetical protein